MNIVESIRHGLGLVGDCQRDCPLYRWCGSGTTNFKFPDNCILSNAADEIVDLKAKIAKLQTELDGTSNRCDTCKYSNDCAKHSLDNSV